MPPDLQLDTAQQAHLLGVTLDTLRAYRWRFGPGHKHPYPDRDEHGRVSRTALLTWQTQRSTSMGRPRLTPPGLTTQQWRDLQLVAAGQPGHPNVITRLEHLGLIRTTPRGATPTTAGQAILDRWTNP